MRADFSTANATLLAALALTLPLAACGNKEPPQPPPRMVPAQTDDLQISQRGLELQLSLTYPSTTISGLALPGVEAVEVRRMIREIYETAADEQEAAAEPEAEVEEAPAEEERVEPPPAPSLFGRLGEVEARALPAEERVVVDPREFPALATTELRIEGAELAAAVSGDRLLLRLPIEPPADADVEPVQVYGVVTFSSRGLASEVSNLATIQPRRPPPAPALERVDARARGIKISWSADDPAVGFRVYRRSAESRTYRDPLAEPGAETRTYLDVEAQYGNRYVYTVTAVARSKPLTESALAAEREVDYRDRYAPPPPDGLVILAETGRVRLLWEPAAADDVAGYRVYRQSDGENEFWRLVDEPRVELGYVDSEVASGRRYRYYVTAVDLNGNESEASESGEAVVP